MKLTLIFVVVVLLAWMVWGYLSSRVEQASYTVLMRAQGYEIREYASHIEAQTIVSGTYTQGLESGFRIIAGYIFGGNQIKEKIAMTAPVTAGSGGSKKIAMTAPVMVRADETATRTVAFVMPKDYTLDSLPTPTDSRVTLVEVPARKMAALRFSWYATPARVVAMEQTLLAALSRDGITVLGTPVYAGYNAPWTPPWMVRNEVLVEIQ